MLNKLPVAIRVSGGLPTLDSVLFEDLSREYSAILGDGTSVSRYLDYQDIYGNAYSDRLCSLRQLNTGQKLQCLKFYFEVDAVILQLHEALMTAAASPSFYFATDQNWDYAAFFKRHVPLSERHDVLACEDANFSVKFVKNLSKYLAYLDMIAGLYVTGCTCSDERVSNMGPQYVSETLTLRVKAIIRESGPVSSMLWHMALHLHG